MFEFLIPLAVVCIPLTVVVGKFIVQPLLAHHGTPAENARVATLEQRLALMEQQMEQMDRSVARIAEGHEFDRALRAGAADGVMATAR